ncbi:MAG: glycosyltransferase family 4 protein [Proteobacteria bacterium]|nr:glycosyltransferase family 4 protein [Pseudomonadota bacterium]
MRITFLLPGSGHRPIGGFKVVYEYANRLVRDGHFVTLLHLQMVRPPHKVFKKILLLGKYVERKIFSTWRPTRWFKLDPRINMRWLVYPHERNAPLADIIIATGWDTANIIDKYDSNKGEKCYLIQHYEVWASSDPDAVNATWKLPLHKIVIARWLQDIAENMGEHADYIPNGLDFNAFGIDRPLDKRSPESVLLLYHWRPYKGTQEAVQALKLIKKSYPNLKVTMFGVPKRPKNLPNWIVYYRNPQQDLLRELYNKSGIFIAPSHTEGWGLTASEAMMCGCAVVATDVGGHREFAINNETAILVPPGNIQQMVEAIGRLIDDHQLRIALGGRASEYVKRFTWERSYNKLVETLKKSENPE